MAATPGLRPSSGAWRPRIQRWSASCQGRFPDLIAEVETIGLASIELATEEDEDTLLKMGSWADPVVHSPGVELGHGWADSIPTFR